MTIFVTFYIVLVVWNPWIDKAKALVDFEDDEYHEMICLEVGNITPCYLKSGDYWEAGQILVAL